MKHTFRSTANRPTHRRLADNVLGVLRSHEDTVTVEPVSALVDPEDYELIPPDPQPVSPEPARELSKLTLKRRLEALGKWETFKTVLAAQPSLDDEFWLAQSISTGDPMFTTHADALKVAVGLSDAEFTSLLSP